MRFMASIAGQARVVWILGLVTCLGCDLDLDNIGGGEDSGGTPNEHTDAEFASDGGADGAVDAGADAEADAEVVEGDAEPDAVNQPDGEATRPVAEAAAVEVAEDDSVEITLGGIGDDFRVVDGPGNGVLEGAPPTLTYHPEASYNGAGRFTCVALQDVLEREPAEIYITVTPVEDAPVIEGQSPLSTAEDTALPLSVEDLEVSDADGPLMNPTLEVLAGDNYSVEDLDILPALDFNGVLEVGVRINDGSLDSEVFALRVEVTPVNDAPTVEAPDPLSTPEDTPLLIEVAGHPWQLYQLTQEQAQTESPTRGVTVQPRHLHRAMT